MLQYSSCFILKFYVPTGFLRWWNSVFMYEREENAQFSLISYSKERRFRVYQTLPDSWKNKKQLQVLTWFLKLVYYRDYLGEIWRNSKIHYCQPILENYRHWLLNTIYKWSTSCLLKQIIITVRGMAWWSESSEEEKCSGTVDNLLIDRMVCQDSQRGKRNLSMAWVDFRKAFDAVDHRWLREVFELHRFPRWLGVVIRQLSNRWNTRIVVKTTRTKPNTILNIFFF